MSIVSYGFNVISTRGDGHCLLYAIIGSWQHQIDHTNKLCLESIKCQLFNESITNSNKYLTFLPNTTQANYTKQLRNYITHKIYNSAYGDLVPTILANTLIVALSIKIRIFNVNENGSLFVLVISPWALIAFNFLSIEPMITSASALLSLILLHVNPIGYNRGQWAVNPPSLPQIPIITRTAIDNNCDQWQTAMMVGRIGYSRG